MTLTAHLLTEKGATCVRSTAWYGKTRPTFSDAIALVRRQLWEHFHFSTSQQETDMINIPRALLERFLKRYAMRRNWTKSSLEPSSSPHADQVPCAVLVRAEKRASPLNPWVGHRSLRARSAPL